jgi:hypothetical protein
LFKEAKMPQVIIFNQPSGIPAVLVATDEALASHTLLEIGIKDVPAGVPFAIVDSDDLPLDIPQEAWEVDNEDLTDGVGGESNEFEAP